MKKSLLLFLMAFMVIATINAQNVNFKNFTDKTVDVEINYPLCKNDKFSVEPGKTVSKYRGACTITQITATGAEPYTSPGTLFSEFGLIKFNDKLEVHHLDASGNPLDLPGGGYPRVTIVNKTNQTLSGKIKYLSVFGLCKDDSYTVLPDQTFTPIANRGLCLLTEITGTSQDGKSVISYTSSGTSFSKFGIVTNPVTEEFEAHRVDDNGVACDIQPGFIIRNKTEFPVEVSLDQVGCLYHGVIMPNQVMERNTGGVWFTINYQLNMDGTPKIDDFKDCVLPVADVVASSLLAAVSGGASAGIKEAAKQAAKIVAKKFITETAAKEMAKAGLKQIEVAVCKAFLKKGVTKAATSSLKYAFKGKNTNGIKSMDQLTAQDIKEDLEEKYSGKLYGQYAGSPLGLYEKPTYEITNGPTIDILDPNDPTPTAVINTVDGSSSGLCITKVNTVGDDMMPLSSKSKCDPNTNKNTPTKPLTNTPSTTPSAAKNSAPAGSIWTYSQNNQTLLTSPNGKFTLVYQGDGNLVLYKNITTPIWASNTDRKSSATFKFQTDGNLVIYGAGNSVVWSPNCYGKGGQTLTLQDDGNLVVYLDYVSQK